MIEQERRAEARAREDARRARDPKAVVVRLLPVHYARAEDLAAVVRPFVSRRGTVTWDPANNVLVVTEERDRMHRVEKIVAEHDVANAE